MPVVAGRQYRTFDASGMVAREEEAEGRPSFIVEGYATTFDSPYELFPGEYEVIDRHAIDGADQSDVIFQYDHQGLVMARNKNGSLALMADDHGLFVRADLSATEAGRELHGAIKAGLVDQMSWGFMIAEGGADYDLANNTFTIRSVSKLFDVSAVSVPANPQTTISARSYLDGAIEAALRESKRRQRARVAAAVRARLCTR